MSEKITITNPVKDVLKYSWAILSILILVGYVLAEKKGIRSVSLGFIFSGIGFYCLCKNQEDLLIKKKTKYAFIGLAIRLFTYGIAISIAILVKNYFNLLLVLLSLFSFQVFYIVLEATKSIKSIRQGKKSG